MDVVTRTTYDHLAQRCSFPPRISMEGVRDTLSFYAEQNSDFKNRKAEQLSIQSLMHELDKEGFWKKLGQ
jgi:hypothetical protein